MYATHTGYLSLFIEYCNFHHAGLGILHMKYVTSALHYHVYTTHTMSPNLEIKFPLSSFLSDLISDIPGIIKLPAGENWSFYFIFHARHADAVNWLVVLNMVTTGSSYAGNHWISPLVDLNSGYNTQTLTHAHTLDTSIMKSLELGVLYRNGF